MSTITPATPLNEMFQRDKVTGIEPEEEARAYEKSIPPYKRCITVDQMKERLATYDIVIIGCGLSGAVLAERYANILGKKCLILEKRFHIGGNCYDYIDQAGVRVNLYGAHLFHTVKPRVWKYVTRWCKWVRWEHEVVGMVDKQLVPIPPNIKTVNMLFNESIANEADMEEWLDKVRVAPPSGEAKDSREMALSRVGEGLYKKMFEHYTKKQWNRGPEDLKPEVLARIPCRNNYDTRYFGDKYQALPEQGYTKFFEGLLDNDKIDIVLDIDYFKFKDEIDEKCKYEKLFFTGPIDAYYDKEDEKLEYRSIIFRKVNFMNTPFFQPNSVVNYPGPEVDFTRIVEYKHFLNWPSEHTCAVAEYSTDEGDPYYPVPNERNQKLYEKYQALAMKETKVKFVGRLASYKYFNMDQAILNALEFFDETEPEVKAKGLADEEAAKSIV
jgi:UDP-galactopyranose mutase